MGRMVSVALVLLCGSLAGQVDAAPAMQALLRQVAANEAAFERARGEYTYRQDFQFHAFDQHRNPGGAYHVVSDVTFTPAGQRYERNLHGPDNTLTILRMTDEDFTDLRHVVPFLLTPDTLPQYTIRFDRREPVELYDGRGQPLGRITGMIFFVSPRQIFPGHRYFHGRIWVDPGTAGIVRISGRPEPQIRRLVHGQEEENLFGQFTTYFQRIDGHYWFPVLTEGDDWLDFTSAPVEVKERVLFSNYHHFGARTRIQVLAPVKH